MPVNGTMGFWFWAALLSALVSGGTVVDSSVLGHPVFVGYGWVGRLRDRCLDIGLLAPAKGWKSSLGTKMELSALFAK